MKSADFDFRLACEANRTKAAHAAQATQLQIERRRRAKRAQIRREVFCQALILALTVAALGVSAYTLHRDERLQKQEATQ
jgi:hypothetical protein